MPRVRDRVVSSLGRSATARRLAYGWANRKLFSDFFQHDRMLADRERMDAYEAAIARHLSAADTVIDLGTGTGVLAMLAARQGATVHAVEHGKIIEAAEAVARDNGIENVEFHRSHSSKLELPGKVDAILHEQIGEAAYDERVVENMAELRERLLKPGGRIYPRWLDLYVEPVQLREDQRSPFAWQQRVEGIDFRALREFATPSQQYLCKVLRPFPFGHFLCEPEPVVSIDLQAAEPADLPKRIAYRRPVLKGGFLDGFCVYFSARFDEEIVFGSSPAGRGTSWGNPLLRVESQEVAVGDAVVLSLSADPLSRVSSWRWDWDRGSTVSRSSG